MLMLAKFGIGKPRETGAVPFSFSGSWETGAEDWTFDAGASRSAGNAQNGSWKVSTANSKRALFEPIVAPGELSLGIFIYQRCASAVAINREVFVYRDGGYISLGNVTDSDTSYQLLSGSISSVGFGGSTFQFGIISYGGTAVYWDDWLIRGLAF